MRFRHASCRNFGNKWYPRLQTEINRMKKMANSQKCGVKIATTPRRYRFWKVKFWRWLQFELGWLASRNETNTMPLPSMYQFFDIEFSFEFGQKDNNFGVSFYTITFAVSISSWFNFCEFGMVNAFTKIHARPSQPFKNHPKSDRNLTSVCRSPRTAPP